MKALKKIKFSDIIGMLERDEMREILGGSGGGGTTGSGGEGNYGFGGGGQGTALSGAGTGFGVGFTGSNYGGFGGSNAVGGGVYGSGSNTGAGTSSYPGSFSGSYGTNNLNSSTNSNNYSYNGGWTFNPDGSRTTNDPTAISRYLGFLNANNGNVTNNQMYEFLSGESSAEGREMNSLKLPGVILNEVPVVNNYKGPSTIPKGVVYDSGILHINPTNSGQGGATNSTSAVLTPFTKSQVTDGLNKVKFSEMALGSVIDWDPIKKDFNYSSTFLPGMKLNADGAYAIALFENLSLTTYDKDSNKAKHTTVGFGHKLHDGAMKTSDVKSITFDQAVTYLATDLISAQNTLNQKIENMDLTGKFSRNQYLALSDLTFNGGNLVDGILKAMKDGGVVSANDAFTNAYINETNGGVQDRRYFEAQAFINGRLLTPEQARAELVKLGY